MVIFPRFRRRKKEREKVRKPMKTGTFSLQFGKIYKKNVKILLTFGQIF